MLLLKIFVTFLKIGIVSFGGGYAMIPVIGGEIQSHHWLSDSEFTDIIAVSAMAPGPIASNSAAIVGFKLSGILGAVTACIGVTIPSLVIILILGKFLAKHHAHPMVKSAFYGLRPVITGLVIYAAVKLALGNAIIGGPNYIDIESMIVMGTVFILLLKTKIHPLIYIFASGILGIFIF